MKKFSFLVATFLLVTNMASARTLKITNGEWAPWLSKELKEYGVASHIVSEAFKRAGHEVEFGFFPWKRAFEKAKADWDGSVVWSYNEEREKNFYYSKPIFSSKTVFFHRKDKPLEWKTLEDIAGRTVGTTVGYFYSENFKKAVADNVFKTAEASNDVINFKKLVAGRIDLFLSDEDVGMSLLNENFSPEEVDQITFHPRTLRETSYHLLLNKAKGYNGQVLEDFNKALTEMEKDGTHKKFLTDSQKGLYKK